MIHLILFNASELFIVLFAVVFIPLTPFGLFLSPFFNENLFHMKHLPKYTHISRFKHHFRHFKHFLV
nr:MAG TPA: hypothetical protein [Caudoviricetes sp.]